MYEPRPLLDGIDYVLRYRSSKAHAPRRYQEKLNPKRQNLHDPELSCLLQGDFAVGQHKAVINVATGNLKFIKSAAALVKAQNIFTIFQALKKQFLSFDIGQRHRSNMFVSFVIVVRFLAVLVMELVLRK